LVEVFWNIRRQREVFQGWTPRTAPLHSFTAKEILMFRTTRTVGAATYAASVAFSLLAGCASTAFTDVSLGTPAEGRSYDRKILIGTNARFVNVFDEEVIKFVVQEPDGAERSFTWHFDAARGTVGDLSKLAPAGALGRPVRVNVETNPRYL
jgi:hypothetical protein